MLLDIALIVVIGLSLLGGWRRGALAAVITAVGVISGLIVGLAIAPFLLAQTDSTPLRVALLVTLVVVFVGVGNAAGAAAGAQVRGSVRNRTTRRIDSLVGAGFQALAMALVLWFISIPLAAAVPGQVGDAVRSSKVFTAIDAAAPAGVGKVPAKLAAMLDESGLPPLVSPFGPPRGAQVAAPDPDVVDPEMVASVRAAVVQVRGDAGTCQRKLTGSGFVVADNYVLTNAHVVAGTDVVSLDTVLGLKQAEVVFYDPDVDIAVLRVDRLGIDPLPWGQEPLLLGDDAVVMGYPLSGPFEAAPARIRGRLNISGPDIYARGRVDREAYVIRGEIRQGNSGGPLLNPAGEVVGMIFGASLDSSDTGYALTGEQVRARVEDAEGLRDRVDTQACVGAL